MTSTKQAYEWVKADHWSFLQFNEWLDAVRLSQRTEQEPEWKPTEADYKEWWDRHGLHGPTSRDAFYDAASLYLNASSPAQPAETSAERTLRSLGYTNNGGEFWKPPLGAWPPQRTEQETVIDKSAAIRIATALGWEPKREWVGLTDDQQIALLKDSDGKTRHWLVWQVEAKLKEKNT